MNRKTYRCAIVITAYNVERYIEQSVASALNQTEKCEVIVVEDKSTDGTLDILRRIKGITLLENSENVGAGLSRRRGIDYASADYVMTLDGDDYIDLDFVKRLLATADATGADIVSGGVKILKEDGSWDATSYGNCVTKGRDKVAKFWGERIVFMNNKIIRKELCNKVPYSDRRYIEDTPTIIPMMFFANKVVYADTIGYVYRMRSDSLTHTTNILKDVVFKGLCWIDLYEFFMTHDQGMFEAVNVKGFIVNIIGTLNKIHVTPEMVAPFEREWHEFTMRLLNVIEITNINLVGGENKNK